MKCLARLSSLLLLTMVPGSSVYGSQPETVAGEVSAVKLGAAEVEALIDRLTTIDSFDIGLSAGMSGSDFPPVAGQYHFGSGLISPAVQHGRNEALLNLVQAGPSALEILLKHLDDKRPTQLAVKHEDMFGSMRFGKEVPKPKWAGGAESDASKLLPDENSAAFGGESIRDYSVTVGDACFAIIGMITNRPYNAVRYQPTACIILNSPVHEPEIATVVRNIWKDGAGPEQLQAFLNRDLEHGDPGAATRLLYDFPAASAAPVVTRLRAVATGKNGDLAGFIQAIAWSPDAAIRDALRPLVMSSHDAAVVVAGAQALATPGETARRDELLTLAQRWKAESSDPQRDAAAAVLEKALECSPGQADATLTAFLGKATDPSRLVAIRACYPLDRAPIPPLQALLKIKRPGYAYYLTDGEGVQDSPGAGDYSNYRMCDHAYELISRALGDKEAKCTGNAVAMDRRILALTQRLAAGAQPFIAEEIAARQAEQNQIRNRRQGVLGSIAQAAGDPAKHAAMIFLEDSLPEADRQAALIQLYDNASPGEHDSLGGGQRDMVNLLLNRRNQRELLIDRLDPETRKQVVEHLVQRVTAGLSEGKPGNYPAVSLCNDYTLASLSLPEIGKSRGPALMNSLQSAFEKKGLPPGDDFSAMMEAANALLDQDIPGAAEWVAAVAGKISPAFAKEHDYFHELFSGMVAHQDLAPLQQVAERMFLGAKSPWNPAIMSRVVATSMENGPFLEIPAFKKGLLAAIRDSAIRDEKWGVVIRKDHNTVATRWKGEPDPSESSIDEGELCDLTVAGPGMTVRRADGLLEIFSFFNRGPDESMYFRHYWPKERRDEVIQRWIEFLSKP